jgi:hypothetical protein
MKFGKLAPKRSLKTLALSNYMKASAVAFPPAHAWERNIPYGMLLNDSLGDCVIAGCSHLEMAWQSVAHAGDTPFVPTDDQVTADYSAVGGYVKGDSSTDQGCNMLDAMHYGLRTGFVGRPPWQSFATLDVQNVDQVKAAVYIFCGVPIGFSVPQSMVDEMNAGIEPTFKFVPNDKPSGEGHCVLIVGYGRSGIALISWGKVYRPSWDFFLQNTDEAYCVSSKDWLKASGISPTGVDIDGLVQDQAVILAA